MLIDRGGRKRWISFFHSKGRPEILVLLAIKIPFMKGGPKDIPSYLISYSHFKDKNLVLRKESICAYAVDEKSFEIPYFYYLEEWWEKNQKCCKYVGMLAFHFVLLKTTIKKTYILTSLIIVFEGSGTTTQSPRNTLRKI